MKHEALTLVSTGLALLADRRRLSYLRLNALTQYVQAALEDLATQNRYAP